MSQNYSEIALLQLCNCNGCALQPTYAPILGVGPARADIVIVGEAPEQAEVRANLPLAGQTGNLLELTFKEHGLDLETCFVTNTLLCERPIVNGKLAAITQGMIQSCSARLLAEIKAREPKIVLLLGAAAAQAVLQTHAKIHELSGVTQWSDELDAYVIVSYHPMAIIHGNVGFFDDLFNAVQKVKAFTSGAIPWPPKVVDIVWEHVTDGTRARVVIDELMVVGGRIALDLETDGFDHLADPILQLVLTTMQKSYVIEWECVDPVQLRRLLLLEPAIEFVLHNQAFDFRFLYEALGCLPEKSIDTMALALCLTERGDAVSLKRLSREWLNAGFYEEELKQFLPNSKTPYSAVPRPILAKYAAADGYYTLRLADILLTRVELEGNMALYENVLLPAQRCFALLEHRGVLIDQDWAGELTAAWKPQIEAAVQAIRDLAAAKGFDARNVIQTKDPTLNPRSFPQLQHLIFDVMGYQPIAGKRTTGVEFLERYPDEKITQLLQGFREVDGLQRTYVNGILDDVSVDGRVHPDFLLFGTVTGRISIHNPPLQTVPKWGVNPERAKLVRKLFIPTPGYAFVEADYSQLELRVGWHYSRDPALGEAIMSGDFHSVVASRAFNKPITEVTGQDRFMSKFITFGLMYGRQAYSLAQGELNCSEAEAQTYVNNWFASFPMFHAWWLEQQAIALDTGLLTTPFGRRRRWNLITPDLIQGIRNQSVNFPIQSLSSDMCLLACIKLASELRKRDWGYTLFTVHDAIIFEVRTERLAAACELIRKTMIAPTFETCAVFDVDIATGPSWGEMETWPAE